MNWDLSGRFYHYMGMYAPPVPADGEWLNRWNPFGATGGRLTYNVSYASQDALYAQAQALGFATLSYWNLFEFGMNVYPVHKNLPSPVTPGPNDFRNATLYLSNNLADAMLRANWNYRGRQRTGGGLATDPQSFTWNSKKLNLDLQGEYFLRRGFALFANLRNVNDATEDVEITGPLTPAHAQFRSRQDFGSLWTIGFKGNF